jgi:hypothetical protein
MTSKTTNQLTVDREELLPIGQRQCWRTSESLRPGLAMMEAAAQGNKEAIAIRNIWGFRHPVTLISKEAFDRLVQRSAMVFGG